MGKLRATNIEPQSGTNLTLGASGDTVTINSTDVRSNTIKDAGGNTLWTSNGSGVLSSVNSALAGGGLTKISSQTASSSSTIDFTTGMDSTYDEYMFVYLNMYPSAGGNIWEFKGRTGGSFGTEKTSSYFRAHQDASNNYDLGWDNSYKLANSNGWQAMGYSVSDAAGMSVCGTLTFYQPSNTVRCTQYKAECIWTHSSNYSHHSYVGGYFHTSNAITGAQFEFSSGNISAGTIILYGVS